MSFGLLAACGTGSDARAEDPEPRAPAPPVAEAAERPTEVKRPLAVTDVGIWSDLDGQVSLPAPRSADLAVIDAARKLLTIYADGHPQKSYPTSGDTSLTLEGNTVSLRASDAAELKSFGKLEVRVLEPGEAPPGDDADGDGIPNSLDLLIGAQKTVLNAATYGAGYIKLEYPNGDVPREVGVCSDVVIRAVRNAGVDLQSALYRDIASAKRSYPMVKKRNRHIDHRRVKTLLPYFRRHWDARSKALKDAGDPLLPGDVIFMDTFPNRSGPDHIGIVSSKMGESGQPLIINNWTDGSVTAELDLLHFVPITHRFRMK